MSETVGGVSAATRAWDCTTSRGREPIGRRRGRRRAGDHLGGCLHRRSHGYRHRRDNQPDQGRLAAARYPHGTPALSPTTAHVVAARPDVPIGIIGCQPRCSPPRDDARAGASDQAVRDLLRSHVRARRVGGGDRIRHSPWSRTPPRATVGATARCAETMQRRRTRHRLNPRGTQAHPQSPRFATTRPAGPTTSARSPRESRRRRRCAPSNGASATPSGVSSKSTSAAADDTGPGGQPGTTLQSSVAG